MRMFFQAPRGIRLALAFDLARTKHHLVLHDLGCQVHKAISLLHLKQKMPKNDEVMSNHGTRFFHTKVHFQQLVKPYQISQRGQYSS